MVVGLPVGVVGILVGIKIFAGVLRVEFAGGTNGAGVTDCDDSGVSIGDERIETRTIMWAAGVKASPVAESLGVESDRA